jgi:SsrA-binding protein
MSEDLVRNRRAAHLYNLLETWEAGLVLAGTEVKSVREGKAQLQDAYVDASGGELWLRQANISPYTFGTYANHDPLRPRKLLLHKEEIHRILARAERKGFTIVPLALFLSPRGQVKVRIALAEGKLMGDKREALKEREAKREMDRVRKGSRDGS